MTSQTRASWIFGSLFVVFVLGVFLFGPPALPDYKQRLLAYICALLAGLFGLFFTGSLLLKAQLPMAGKWSVQGGAGFALFLIVLFWWSTGSAPVKSAKANSASGLSPAAGPASPSSNPFGAGKTVQIPPDRLLQATPFRARMDDCPKRSCDIEFILRGYDSQGRLRYDHSASFKDWITGQFRDTVFNSTDKMYFEHQEQINFQLYCRIDQEPYLVGDQRTLDWKPFNEANEYKNYSSWLACGSDNFKASVGIGVNVATVRFNEPPVRPDPGQPK